MRSWRIVAVLLVALGLVAVAGCSRSREVPNVVGMPYDQAVKQLQDDGFKLGDTKYGYSNNATAGLVARQSPSAGVKLERNGSVVLTVVKPLGSLTTPNVVGQTQAQAESALATMSLKPSVTQDYSAEVPAGVVFLQAPAAGALINPGDTVEMVVSKGAAPVKVQVPKIDGKNESDAAAALKAVGLLPVSSDAYSDTVAKGIVFGQNPVAGASMSPGSNVTFVVSLGQGTQSITIPNVVGKSQADAEAAIKGAGLVPSVVTNIDAKVPKGIVAGSKPCSRQQDRQWLDGRHSRVTWTRHIRDGSRRRRQDGRRSCCSDHGRRAGAPGCRAARCRGAQGYSHHPGSPGRRQGAGGLGCALYRFDRSAGVAEPPVR